MPTFRKKPVEVEAIQFDGQLASTEDINRLGAGAVYVPRGYEHRMRYDSEQDRSNGHVLDDAPPYLVIHTLEGDHRANVGDWIIRGVAGELYPCKPDIFEATYDPA
ncbi:hypothetical protein GCM10010124_26000 [Pilimelia terevasa]|uniref:Uncharacterized protein n=1 Tax=Pilimelia terevasa TaxID=53372 RepID=A0A8J3BV31_9ACTN|nr:hypothetical protein [Pilimelia terevasa]GGK32047.1 hypothetical protein GCM10010124_26000 [Pilimelia terevasa]